MKRNHFVFKPVIYLDLILMLLACTGCSSNQGLVLDEQTESITGTSVSNVVSEESIVTNAGIAVSELPMVKVYVCGEVCNPGVYELPNASRLIDAVTAAGGMGEQADWNAVNLAQSLVDGQMIRIAAVGENLSASGNNVMDEIQNENTNNCSTTSNKSDLININTAKENELMEIPGIGSSKAQAIIRYRDEQGAFKSIEEIMKIEGIKQGVFEKIKQYICIE